jgi:hypothetical protein
VWQGLKPLNVELVFQLMVEPWPTGLTDGIQVKAFLFKQGFFYKKHWDNS